MKKMKLKLKRLFDCRFDLPKYETEGSAGFDLRAHLDRPVELGPNNHYTFSTGFCFELPAEYELQIRPRSSLTIKHRILCQFGTVDSDYRGEVRVQLVNMGRSSYVVMPGERIAQAVIAPIIKVEFEEVNELSKTERGSQGFGSTGKG